MSSSPISALDPEARALAALHGDELYAALSRRFNLSSVEVTVGAGAAQRDFHIVKPSNADHLISEADYVHDERLPYWADLWPSARVLAGVLLNEIGEGRSLLEMGCGLGLDSIAAIAAGFKVTSTDYYEDALHVTRANAKLNLETEPSVRMVNWRDWPCDLGWYDVVIAADVLYEKEYAELVANCIAKSLHPEGTAFVADPGRLALPKFREHLPLIGLSIASIDVFPFEEGEIRQSIQIMRIRWSPDHVRTESDSGCCTGTTSDVGPTAHSA